MGVLWHQGFIGVSEGHLSPPELSRSSWGIEGDTWYLSLSSCTSAGVGALLKQGSAQTTGYVSPLSSQYVCGGCWDWQLDLPKV